LAEKTKQIDMNKEIVKAFVIFDTNLTTNGSSNGYIENPKLETKEDLDELRANIEGRVLRGLRESHGEKYNSVTIKTIIVLPIETSIIASDLDKRLLIVSLNPTKQYGEV
jgi:hypothetical protein